MAPCCRLCCSFGLILVPSAKSSGTCSVEPTMQPRLFSEYKETTLMQGHNRIALALFAALLCCWSRMAQAQTSDYHVQFTPYGFWTGVNGTVGEQGRTANVDASFGDIIRHLDMVAMVYFDARIGRWRLLVDNIYVKVSN